MENICDLTNKNCLIDLHIHLDGSLSIDSVKQLAKMQNIDIPNSDSKLNKMLSVDKGCRNLNEYLQKFDFPCSLLQTKQAITQAVLNLMTELKQQGLIYAEVRFAPQKHTNKGLTQNDVVLAAMSGLKQAELQGGLILCCMRGGDTHQQNMETIQLAHKYLGKGVVAVDLAGAEALFPTQSFKAEFDLAKQLKVPFTIHAGEASGVESVKTALEFGAKRLGHGVRAVEDETVLKTIVEKGIVLECCPTSNLQTQVFDDIAKFPVKKFLDSGVKFTTNTDNTTVSATNLRDEWNLIIATFGLTDLQVKSILLNSVDGAFAKEKTKQQLRDEIEKQF